MLDVDIISVNEMDGFVEVCLNLIGQTEIDIPITFTTANQSAIGMTITCLSHV